MGFLKTIKTLGRAGADLVFPIYCLVCGNSDDAYLCQACVHKIPKLEKQFCIACQRPSPFGKTHPTCISRNRLDGIISALPYTDQKVKEIIAAFKYSFADTLAERLSGLLVQEMKTQDLGEYFAEFKVIPVPLHQRRLNWRGFNQSVLLAEPLSRMLNIPVEKNLITRTRFTKPQTDLKREERAINIANAFTVNKNAFSGKYLLVDDVVTTGSTLNEIAKLLKQNGAQEVWALTLAHG